MMRFYGKHLTVICSFLVFFILNIAVFSIFGCTDYSIPSSFDLNKVSRKYKGRVNNAIKRNELNKAELQLKKFEKEINVFKKFSFFTTPEKIEKAMKILSELKNQLEGKQRFDKTISYANELIESKDYDKAESLLRLTLNKSGHCLDQEKKIEELLRQIDSKPPVVYGLNFFRIQSGKYFFGTPSDEKGCDPAMESLPQEYEVEEYYISTTEITQETYYHYLSNLKSHDYNPTIPMNNISYNEAEEFCKLLSENDQRYSFHLPNEVEWEIACRSGEHPDKGPVNAPGLQDRFKDSIDKATFTLQNYAIFEYNRSPGQRPEKVAQKKSNKWGLYDMHGNVAEWCERVSLFKEWYQSELGKQPIRGGSFMSHYERCRAGARSMERKDNRSSTIGFRIIARKH